MSESGAPADDASGDDHNANTKDPYLLPEQEKEKMLAGIVKLVMKPQLEEQVLKEAGKAREEERNARRDHILGIEQQRSAFEHFMGLFQSGQQENAAHNAYNRSASGRDCDPESETDDDFTDVLNLENPTALLDVVDFTTGDDRPQPWMEYFLTETDLLEKRKETLVGLYKEDPVRHGFVLEYHTAVLTPLRAFFVKLLVKRKVWTIVETRVAVFNMMKATMLLVFPVPGADKICELASSILKVYHEQEIRSDPKDKVANLQELVKSWVENTEIFGEATSVDVGGDVDEHGNTTDSYSPDEKEKEMLRGLHKKDAKLYGFIVGDYMIRDLSSLQKIFLPLLSCVVWPPKLVELVSAVTGRAVKQLIYDVPEITEIFHLADSISKDGTQGTELEAKTACLREKVKYWMLNTAYLKENLKSWAEDPELVETTQKFESCDRA